MERIGHYCFHQISFPGLRLVVLSDLEHLLSIGKGFLSNVRSPLEKVQLGPRLPNLRFIDDFFCYGAATLQAVSFQGLKFLEKIGADFLIGCWRLRKVDLTECLNLRTIGDRFCYQGEKSSPEAPFNPRWRPYTAAVSTSYLACVFLPAGSLRNIGDDFCAGCKALSKTNATSVIHRDADGEHPVEAKRDAPAMVSRTGSLEIP